MNVDIWQEQILIPTYKTGVADKNPMFFENRVYQGSSGVVYPNPIIETISDEKIDQEYKALFLENKYLKIMILPELGGRVHMAYDKIAARHFIYYNQVIKPALVGLCGPWISGGIEFNWPQHHRPSTFDPIDYVVEENEDGSKTVWVSEVEKMFHTKGMAGFTLYPDKAYLEIKAQLFNRTSLPQTFLWWANPALSVNDYYQSIFPPDVNAVFDHGRRDVSDFPIATGTYYKVDYSPGTDISRYKNIPVPTSYMAVNSVYDFVGGYDHEKKAGMLHIADHHISPGKKQWTWGNGDFGIAWDRNLTDEDGPYIELMTGVYTDNQPDFSWIMPFEEKTFTQYFLPYRNVGMLKNATKDILIGLDVTNSNIQIDVFATSVKNNLEVILVHEGIELLRETLSISPEKGYRKIIDNTGITSTGLLLTVTESDGREIVRYQQELNSQDEIPSPAKPALLPDEIDSIEELFLTGTHLEQYRHATYSPVPYYEEALRRAPGDTRNNNALGRFHLRRGQFQKSEKYFHTAIETATRLNPNPYDTEPFYNLGVALMYQQKTAAAYDAFFKATWSGAWQDSAYFYIAQIDIINKNYEPALEHINWSLDKNARNGKGYLLKVHTLRKLNRLAEAIDMALYALKRDHFNISVLFELHYCYYETNEDVKAKEIIDRLLLVSRRNQHNLIEYAIEFAALGLFEEAIALLKHRGDGNGSDPMVNYYLAYYWFKNGDADISFSFLEHAAGADPGTCFPNRLEDISILQFAQKQNLKDAKAGYYLGNLWYDKRQYGEAISAWEKSYELDGSFPTVLRNLAIAAFNKEKDFEKALSLFKKAFELDPTDGRILMELDQLYKRLNYAQEYRLSHLEKYPEVVLRRDDLYLEVIALHNFLGDYEKAFNLLNSRSFHPWEGGEGKVTGQYVFSLIEMAKVDILNNRYDEAILKLQMAQSYPANLGEGKLYGAQENDIFYWLGCAYQGLNNKEESTLYWQMATHGLSEPSAAMFYNDQQPDKILYQGLSWEKLGQLDKADKIFNKLVDYSNLHQDEEIRLDYFAVSLPDLLIFDDDLKKRNNLHFRFIGALGYLGLKNFEMAATVLASILKENSSHIGAKIYLVLIHKFKQVLEVG
ncbi:DUF5107 domain-containing protein [Pedobacter sp. L105]|uniref:DUF5107 domain-containing protein n=1 Tax=Pedobacter sp. L105 TaxID=1641871 RepID=UPI00131ADB29|nr:DUF5107 domain-containing protein [Pedobacter sp. L105]